MAKKHKTIAGALSNDRVNLDYKKENLDFNPNLKEDMDFLMNLKEDSTPPAKFTKEVRIKISPETFLQWKEAKKRIEQICGYDNESKVFEFILIEFLNTPLQSYE